MSCCKHLLAVVLRNIIVIYLFMYLFIFYFGQLRTQALASLHCGLQINQGIPVSHVAKWLGMEVMCLCGVYIYNCIFRIL